MVQLETLIFCDRQYHFMMAMSKLHIARLLKHQECYDPITHQQVCKRLLLRMPEFIIPLYGKIMENLNDEQGRRREQTLINIGAITKREKSRIFDQ